MFISRWTRRSWRRLCPHRRRSGRAEPTHLGRHRLRTGRGRDHAAVGQAQRPARPPGCCAPRSRVPVGSALCGIATNLPELIAFRALQGIGAGGVMTLAMATVGDIVSPRSAVATRATSSPCSCWPASSGRARGVFVVTCPGDGLLRQRADRPGRARLLRRQPAAATQGTSRIDYLGAGCSPPPSAPAAGHRLGR